MSMPEWTLAYDSFEPKQEALREALCTLGNGYFCTRGALVTAQADDTHYPGTYLAGGYNRLKTEIAGRIIENEDLVNMPNWLSLNFRPVNGDWFNILAADILSFRQELDLRHGTLTISLRLRDKQSRETTVTSRRFVSMADPHMAGIEMTIKQENWSDPMEVRSALDGQVINAGVKRYRELNSSHLQPQESAGFAGEKSNDEMIYLVVQTDPGKMRVAEAARTRVFRNGDRLDGDGRVTAEHGWVDQTFRVDASEGQVITIEKIVALYTSRDFAIFESGLAAREAVDRAGSFDDLLKDHKREWDRLWSRCDIVIEGHPNAQMILRLHVFHLLQTLSHNSVDLDIGVPARGWHGEAYRGHVFWDEIFILPFIDFHMPMISRAMLRYRYNRLTKARLAAKESGLKGAMYPWQSGSDGREESQVMHLNPRSGRWVPDHSYQQRHVNLSVAYNTWLHYMVTGDKATFELRGIETMVEIARLFASLSTHNPQTDRYEIHRVMGPDEFHEAYPDSDEPGLNNNAYTNVMASWLLMTSVRALKEIDDEVRQETMDKIGLTDDELEHWDEISRKIFVPFHDDGIISQFEGYEKLEEFDWEGYRSKYGNIQRLDRILEAEGDSADRYKLSKQADVLMLFYLFSFPELKDLFNRLGYELTEEMWQKNVDYYMARTSHGSTLSYVVHSWVLAKSRPQEAWEHFVKALHSDVDDIQGGTTAEGIHLGAMSGTVDIAQRCFTGLTVRDGALYFDPLLPDNLSGLKLKLRYLGNWLNVRLTHDDLTIDVHPSWEDKVPVYVRGVLNQLEPGKSYSFPLKEAVA